MKKTTWALIGCMFLGCAAQGFMRYAEPDVSSDKVYRAGAVFAGAEKAVDANAPAADRAGAGPEARDVAKTGPDEDAPAAARLLIYRGELRIVVENISGSIETVRQTAESLGGYMQSMSSSSIVVRVPIGAFGEIVERVRGLGEVTGQEIVGEDVTEKMHDLKIRLDNAVEIRKRLIDLLERTREIDEALKVERELARVSEQIELYKGKIRFIGDQAAFSTLTVRLNSPLPQKVATRQIPFSWVRELGSDLAKGKVMENSNYTDGPGVGFRLPPSFVKYFQDDYLTRAINAEEVLLKVGVHKNYEGGDVAFWRSLIARSLAANQSIKIADDIAADIDGEPAKILIGVKDLGGRKFGYAIGIARDADLVYTYEAWGPEAEFQKVRDEIVASMKTLRRLGWLTRKFCR